MDTTNFCCHFFLHPKLIRMDTRMNWEIGREYIGLTFNEGMSRVGVVNGNLIPHFE